jgi:hypothetical protein
VKNLIKMDWEHSYTLLGLGVLFFYGVVFYVLTSSGSSKLEALQKRKIGKAD